jgi:hypothetical protein
MPLMESGVTWPGYFRIPMPWTCPSTACPLARAPTRGRLPARSPSCIGPRRWCCPGLRTGDRGRPAEPGADLAGKTCPPAGGPPAMAILIMSALPPLLTSGDVLGAPGERFPGVTQTASSGRRGLRARLFRLHRRGAGRRLGRGRRSTLIR